MAAKSKKEATGNLEPVKKPRAKKEPFEFESVIINDEMFRKTGQESKASVRRGESYTSSKNETSEYYHIQKSASPFSSNLGNVGCADAINLCQQAYYNFPSFKNPITMQVYLANSPIHFTGGENEQVLQFYKDWWDKIGGWNVANQFFLEWWRSGNIFLYRFDGEIPLKEVKKIAGKESFARNRKLPLKYVILNPSDIRGLATSSFSDQFYGKVLNAYEVAMLKNPQTDFDKQVVEGLTPEARADIARGLSPILKLDSDKMRICFNGKQDYESMAVPPYFGVLKDINLKESMKTADAKVAASADYCILLITAGNDKMGMKERQFLVNGLGELFKSQSVGRVLFSDYTAKAEFVIPDLAKIMGAAKYEVVDRDIVRGMVDIMSKDENFSSGVTKSKIYLELLNQARESFLRFFLIPEMERIATEMGFAGPVTAEFEEISLDSIAEARKLYNRLYELGALTTEELFHAYESNMLPKYKDSLESQKEFRKLRKQEIYEPLIGGPADKAEGRPTGTKAPQTTKKVSPRGQASLEKIQETFPKFGGLLEKVEGEYKKKNSLVRLSKSHKRLCESIFEQIILHEKMENWVVATIQDYLSQPMRPQSEQGEEIFEIMGSLETGILPAALFYHNQN